MERGSVVGALAVLLLGGCGDQVSGSAATPAGPVVSPTAIPAAAGAVEATATVLDDGDGPELCLGGVADSLPPQCDGPPVEGWDWDVHPEHESVDGVKWGEFRVVGEWDGTTFTVTDARRAAEGDHAVAEEPEVSPCEEPEGGWVVVDPANATRSARNALGRTAEKRADYGLLWIDNSINPANDRYQGGDYSPDVLDQMNDPAQTIVNIGVTGDPAEAEAELRPLWGGPLCVYRLANTHERLREVAEDVMDLPGFSGGGYGSVANVVELGVVFDDGSMQEWADETYGEGVVEITSALVPAD